ncbi:hypothetical protein AUJ14_01315 [Candidatus Micrarchaeota archaeon CG1_02_55_22]|nr:MAG: hypothetical protein AUJ14_01315 [Candidatus Micrarchaeota archaeon CG1_02_55_22]
MRPALVVLFFAALAVLLSAAPGTCDDPTFKGICVVASDPGASSAPSLEGDWKQHVVTTEFGCSSDAQTMASGIYSTARTYYAALPTRRALNRNIQVRGPNGKVLTLPVLDVGPFCVRDESYVFGSARPLAEIYRGQIVPVAGCNRKYRATGAGLDVSCQAARELGISGKGYADWRFV